MGVSTFQAVLLLIIVSSSAAAGGGRTPTSTSGTESECTMDYVQVTQGPVAPLPNGTPTYNVQIINQCTQCQGVRDVHLRCGWFASAELINPTIFRRLAFDDCLVNDGNPIPPGGLVSFNYAEIKAYDLSVKSLNCID